MLYFSSPPALRHGAGLLRIQSDWARYPTGDRRSPPGSAFAGWKPRRGSTHEQQRYGRRPAQPRNRLPMAYCSVLFSTMNDLRSAVEYPRPERATESTIPPAENWHIDPDRPLDDDCAWAARRGPRTGLPPGQADRLLRCSSLAQRVVMEGSRHGDAIPVKCQSGGSDWCPVR